jgi:hypothetical protein
METRTQGMNRRGQRGCARAAAGVALFVLATAVALPATAAAPEPNAKRSEATADLRFDVVGGRWNFTGRHAALKDVAAALAAKAPVEVRIQDPELEVAKVGVAFQGADLKQGMAFVLGAFNYSEFDDPKSGKRVYLVTSLTREVKPAPETRTVVATVQPKAVAATSSNGSGKGVTSIDEFRKVAPATITSREQSQAEIEAEYKREREEKLLRAMDALKSKDVNGTVQMQALADLSASGDPRATAVLKEAWTQTQGMPNAAPQVARSAWQHAAQLQFANGDANALLLSMTASNIPAVREVAQAGKVDMERYRAAQNPR